MLVSVIEKAPNRTFQSEESSSSSQFLVVCIFNWMLGQLRKSCGKVVCSWKSSEFKSTESYEKAPRPQPNLVFAQFSVVCMFNWMLGQLRRAVGRSFFERSYILNLLTEGDNWTSNKVKNKGKNK